MWVSPFRYPRLIRYLLLPAAFRSLSRLSSALSAKASTLRPFLLNPSPSLYSVTGFRVSFFFQICLPLQSFLFCLLLSVIFTMTASDVLSFYRCSSLSCCFYCVSDRLSRHLHWIFFRFSVFGFQGTIFHKNFDCFISHQKLKSLYCILVFNR